MRKSHNNTVLVAATRWHENTYINVPKEFDHAEAVFGKASKDGVLELPPFGYAILVLTH